MRVIHPEDFKSLPKAKAKKPKLPLVAAVLIAAFAGYMWYGNQSQPKSQNPATEQSSRQENAALEKPKTGALKTFSNEEFRSLARSVKYPNTQQFSEPPVITGNKAADSRIRQIVESRGYVLTSIPVTAIEKIDEPRLDSDDLLQPLAAAAWRELKAAAQRDKMPLQLLSAYRSPEYQRGVFTRRLAARGATTETVAAGRADDAVRAVLETTAVPGYSRHHTGYTIDLWCGDGSGAFLNSKCFGWIKADNYKIAKLAGWIPSYPEGVSLQGPEPESWEYVWVGKDLVTE